MNECDNFDQCQDHFREINRKLDQLDEAIRGNGKPGIQLRLDRLEAAERGRNRVIWLIAGCALTLAVTSLWNHFIGG